MMALINSIRKLKLMGLFAGLSLPVTSCDIVVFHYVESYVLGYDIYDDIKVWPAYRIGGDKIEGIGITLSGDLRVEFRDKGVKGALYDSLCVANGDLSYDRNVGLLMDDIDIGMAPIAYNPNPMQLDITSDKDFDAEHPAGASLSDIVNATYASYGMYIRNGYKGSEPEETIKLLSELKEEDLLMSSSVHRNPEFDSPYRSYLAVLTFVKSPDNPGETHTLTITVKTEKKAFTAEYEKTF